MRVLVTGNLGYVGTVMTPILAAQGHEVWGLDVGFYEDGVIGPLGQNGVARQIRRDLRDVDREDLDGVEAVIHLAALSNDPTGELDPGLTEEINFDASMRLARLAKEAGADRFVFASSCSIYGKGDDGRLTEESPMHPLTAYARSKVGVEEALSEMADEDFSPVYLRNATAYGFSPRLRVDVVVNNLTGWAVTTGKVKLLSDGTAWRPLVHVEDMSRAFAACLTAPREQIHDQAINVGSEDDNYQIRDVAQRIAGVVPDSQVTIGEGAEADDRTYNVRFDKLRALLPDFQTRWTLDAGIRQLYDAYRENGLTFEAFDGRAFTRLKQLKHLIAGGLVDGKLRRISNETEIDRISA